MKKFLEYLVKEIVSQPKKVKVKETSENGTVKLSFSVAPDDMGFIIGKGGRIISAIRSLLKTAATKAGKDVFLELEEVEND